MTTTMTESEAIAYAATWGSYMTGGDPGACMYGFSPEIGLKVQSEQHRTNCLDWIERCKGRVRDEPDNDAFEPDEAEQLDCLAEMIRNAPIHE